ncbi:MAG: hypothetical protein JSU63_03760 [Phycisphaerales bacterium]|nr:MAG: hypothetical protein JSU63_03760 [Phycisphaerales bacterium]
MIDERFEARMREVSALIETLPEDQRKRLEQLIEETRERHQLVQESVVRAHNALDDRRLWQKYLLFDREACLREGMRDRSNGEDDAELGDQE